MNINNEEQGIEHQQDEVNSTLNNLMKVKTVSFLPGVFFLINAMTGPSIPFISSTFTKGGLLITGFFVIFSILSALSSLFIIEAMQGIF